MYTQTIYELSQEAERLLLLAIEQLDGAQHSSASQQDTGVPTVTEVKAQREMLQNELCKVLMNPLMILVKIIKLRWIHILSYDQMVSRKINNQTTRCANSIFYTTLFTNSAPNYT
ncbi:hypothetical protein AB9V48_01665 [Escherichia fergusonii]|uniref:hypothetical protein n=1 Tax=Escherichia fergusonii TaxID=564 RepID=UPI0039B61732